MVTSESTPPRLGARVNRCSASEKSPGVFSGAVHFEAQDTAAAVHLLHRQGALGMAFDEGIVHAPHLGVLRQKLCDAQGVVILPLHSHRQRLDAAQQQPGGVRIHGAAQRGAGFVDLLDQVLAAGDDAADQVGVSGEIFGAGVHDQVNAEIRRALVDGRGKRAVDET